MWVCKAYSHLEKQGISPIGTADILGQDFSPAEQYITIRVVIDGDKAPWVETHGCYFGRTGLASDMYHLL